MFDVELIEPLGIGGNLFSLSLRLCGLESLLVLFLHSLTGGVVSNDLLYGRVIIVICIEMKDYSRLEFRLGDLVERVCDFGRGLFRDIVLGHDIHRHRLGAG